MKNKQQNKQPKKKEVKKEKPNIYLVAGFLSGLLLLTLMIYLPAVKNGFVWDDSDYVVNNLLIRTINLKEIFSTNLMGNYHPLTVLAFAIEYKLFGIKEQGYHVVNILMHLLNVWLVYLVVFRLSENVFVAMVTTLLFAIHPMHVESVAWVSELKDLLYTFFFLLSYLYFLKFMEVEKMKYYAFALLLFLLSLLSKAMAASLPMLLLLTVFFKKDKVEMKMIMRLIPFFLLSLIFGYIAIQAQQSSGAVDTASFPFPQRIVFACYGFITYLVKLIFPLQLSSYYGYPIPSGGTIPGSYYIYPLLVIGVAVAAIYSLKKTKKIFFGIGFYTVTVFLVLQLLPVGWAIMADRYSYIPSIGFFLLLSEGLYLLWKKTGGFSYKGPIIGLLAIATVFYSSQTSARCAIWKDDFTLWNDVIKQYQTIPQAYINRGIIYMRQNKTTEALNDFNKAIQLEPEFAKGYSNRAIIYTNENKFDEALKDYNKAIQLEPTNAIAYNNKGILYKKFNKFNEAYELFNEAIRRKPGYLDAYYNRGVTLYNLQKYDEAISDFNRTLEMKPNNPSKYIFYRGLSEYQKNNKSVACQDLQTAANMGYQQAIEQYNKLCK